MRIVKFFDTGEVVLEIKRLTQWMIAIAVLATILVFYAPRG